MTWQTSVISIINLRFPLNFVEEKTVTPNRVLLLRKNKVAFRHLKRIEGKTKRKKSVYCSYNPYISFQKSQWLSDSVMTNCIRSDPSVLSVNSLPVNSLCACLHMIHSHFHIKKNLECLSAVLHNTVTVFL